MGQMQIKYSALFSFSIQQLFYKNKVCKNYQIDPVLDLSIIPIGESYELMKRMNMVCRHMNETNGVIVLALIQGKNEAGDELLRYPAERGDKLTFGLFIKNPAILSQSDITAQLMNNTGYYFSNEVEDSGAARNALHLSRNASGVEDDDRVKISTDNYRFHSPVTIDAGSAQVKQVLTGKTVRPSSQVNENGGVELLFNLVALPSGICQLLINGIVKDTFYYTGTPLAQPLFGVVEIILSSTISSNYRVVEADRSLTAARPLFLITFRNRKTIWRYTFQLYPNSPLFLEIAALSPAEKTTYLAKLNIVSNDSAVTFIQTNASDESIIFESQAELLLQENYFISTNAGIPLQLKLEKNIGDAGEKIVKDNLPYPSPSLINTTTPSIIYSDVFITI